MSRLMPSEMVAAVYHGNRDIRIERTSVRQPGVGELTLRVTSAGVCGTDSAEWEHGPTMTPLRDRHGASGHLGPMIPGHEFGGRIVGVGEGVAGFDLGSLVASGAGVSCGDCPACGRGYTNFCDTYFTLGLQSDGGLAEYVTVPASTCLAIDDYGLTDDEAALVQPMAIALHTFRQAGQLDSQSPVVVLGAGGVGVFLVYAAASSGLQVVAADLDSERLQVAADLGAAATVRINPDHDLGAQMVAALDRPASTVYEVTGSRAALQASIHLVEPRGRVVAVGLSNNPRDLDMRRVTLGELGIVGTNAHVFGDDFAGAAELLSLRKGGWSDVAPDALPLHQLVDEALRPMAERRASRIKTLIDPSSEASRPTVMGGR